MHGAKKHLKNSICVRLSLSETNRQVCALMQNITTTADKGNKRVMLHTDSHFQPATQYLLFIVPTCLGHNKMEVKSLCTLARHTENV
jgi:hypothetical protein